MDHVVGTLPRLPIAMVGAPFISPIEVLPRLSRHTMSLDTNLSKGDCNAFTSDHTASGIATTPINPFPDPGSSWCGASFIAKLSVDMTAAANLK
jgi:hypothetical protein